MASELHQLLTNGEISGPYVLVGHSLGGFAARLYRQAHPDDIVGMVLVDAGHKRQFDQMEFGKFVTPGKTVFPIVRAMTALGLTRLLMSLDLAPSFFATQEAGVSAEMRPLLRAGWMQSRYFKTMAYESAALEGTAGQTWIAGSLGDLPLIVLTATGPTWWPNMPSNVDRRASVRCGSTSRPISSNCRPIAAKSSPTVAATSSTSTNLN